jgi:hypothetical protein
MLIQRRREGVAVREKYPYMQISAMSGTESLNHPGKTSAFAPFFDRESR